MPTWHGPRQTSLRIDLYTPTEELVGTLTGVEGGTITRQNTGTIKTSGSITITNPGNIPWRARRLQPIYTINGEDYPLAMLIPTTPKTRYTATTHTLEIKVLDKLSLLDQEIGTTFVVTAGTNVLQAVTTLIQSLGETKTAFTPSTAVARLDRTFTPDTSTLTIINTLLLSSGYESLAVTPRGFYTTKPYLNDTARPSIYTFLDNRQSIYTPTFTTDEDDFNIPNRIVGISTSSGSTPALTSIAENDDPASPTSHAVTGKWVTKTIPNIDATSQEALDAEVRRQLTKAAAAGMTIDFEHAWIPLDLEDAVTFRNEKAGLEFTAIVQAQHYSLNPLELVQSTMRKAIAL